MSILASVLKFSLAGAATGSLTSIIVNICKKEDINWQRAGKWAAIGAATGAVGATYTVNATPKVAEKVIEGSVVNAAPKVAEKVIEGSVVNAAPKVAETVLLDSTAYTGISSPLFDRDAWQFIR